MGIDSFESPVAFYERLSLIISSALPNFLPFPTSLNSSLSDSTEYCVSRIRSAAIEFHKLQRLFRGFLPVLTLLLPETLAPALFRFLGGTPLLQQMCWQANLSLHE